MILRDLDTSSYNYRRYVISSGDDFSERKACEFEKALAEKAERKRQPYGNFDIKVVPRARKIHQSVLTTPLSALHCGWACIKLLSNPPSAVKLPQAGRPQTASGYPDLILANGPATATVLIISCVILRFLAFPGSRHAMRCVYVESWARVKQLSLSGELLRSFGVCDRILVQWPDLLESNGRPRKGLELEGALIG